MAATWSASCCYQIDLVNLQIFIPYSLHHLAHQETGGFNSSGLFCFHFKVSGPAHAMVLALCGCQPFRTTCPQETIYFHGVKPPLPIRWFGLQGNGPFWIASSLYWFWWEVGERGGKTHAFSRDTRRTREARGAPLAWPVVSLARAGLFCPLFCLIDNKIPLAV